MAKVVLEHVWKRYGDVVAVHDVSLEARDQEFLVLVGPSGCGKTTSLRMVAGLDDISEGAVTIGDRVVDDLSPKDRDIALVFQSYALYPHMNVYDNMAFGLKLRKTPKQEIKQRVEEAADPAVVLTRRAADGPEPERHITKPHAAPIVTMTAADAHLFGLPIARIEIRRDGLASRRRWQFNLREEAILEVVS